MAATQPAAYCKILTLLVPRELKLEHTNPIEALSNEQLVNMIEELKERIARRAAGSDAKVIEAVETTALPAPVEVPKPKRRNRVMTAADTAVLRRDETYTGCGCGCVSRTVTSMARPSERERKPRKRKVPLPLRA